MENKIFHIDWSDVNDILNHGFTAMQMASVHKPLRDYIDSLPHEQKQQIVELFVRNAPDDESTGEEKAAHLASWIKKKLLTPCSERYCRSCRQTGHTVTYCSTIAPALPSVSPAPAAASCKTKFLAHLQSLERLRLVQEFRRDDRKNTAAPVSLLQGRRQGAADASALRPGAREAGVSELAFAADERRRGVVAKVDLDRGVGFIQVPEYGEVRFFLDRSDYGVKEPTAGDQVTLKLDLSRDIPLAIEVRPEKATINLQDVLAFVERCRVSTKPIKLMETVLTQRHEWPLVVRILDLLPLEPQRAAALNTLVAMVTFPDNREPVHLSLLRAFLTLMSTAAPVPASADSAESEPLACLPTVLLCLPARQPSTGWFDPSDIGYAESTRHLDSLVELSTLVLLARQIADIPEEAVDPVAAATHKALTHVQGVLTRLASSAASGSAALQLKIAQKRCTSALSRISATSQVLRELRSAWFPTTEELSVPYPLLESPFHPQNLPVNQVTPDTTVESLVEAQCKLLRADTFEATARTLAAACYTLPGFEPDEDTRRDVQHARILKNIEYCGTVATRDRDFAQVQSYLLSGEPSGGSQVNLLWHFSVGSCVCITTGLDRTKIAPNEIFWGVVSSADSQFLSTGVLVLAPCDGSMSFDLLVANLRRNAALGRGECSLAMELPLFLAGYQGVMRALLSFIGPAGMPLSLSGLLLAQQPQVARSKSSPPIGYIPQHALFAFERLVDDVRQTCTLDPGQDEAMKNLSTQELVLVQGPPGTGKSFIGTRIVEVYIRFKQLLSSGDILNVVDVDALQSSDWDYLAPSIGPVVVITYKNHALDEFLLDLMKTGLWTTERQRLSSNSGAVDGGGRGGGQDSSVFPSGRRIVRVGGRSREAELAAYNLNVLLAGKSDKAAMRSYRDRLYLMHARWERLAKEILLLQRGKVPKSYFDKWLTDDQHQSIRYEDKDEWLTGARYLGSHKGDPVSPTHYLTLLRSALSAKLAATPAAASPTPADRISSTGDDEDIQLSVFKEMKQEDETRETNDSLRGIFLSAEAVALAECPPKLPAGVPQPLLSLWSLHPRLRHEYYAYLIATSIAAKARDCLRILEAMKNVVTLKNHAVMESRLELLRGADVVGFTTTGCAMHQELIRSLRPSLIVVEEAAEVLESQLLACLTDSVKQIVLIGDHYQLKPKVDTYLYEKVNRLNISLFERLAQSYKPIRLVEQRRMHPSISQLIRPFYDGQPIEDHASVVQRPFIDASGVKHYGGVPGLGQTRLFLWDHDHPEECAPRSLSKINTLELTMCVRLVEHLISEGVHPKSITLITPYLGQCRALRNALRLRPLNQLRDVRVSTVDLFQGDESDIIILSMVRTKTLTDFLKMRNRMIVACSRARFAMVIVGNSNLLELSPHWAQVLSMLREVNGIGESIPLSFRGTTRIVKNREWPDDMKSSSVTAPAFQWVVAESFVDESAGKP